MLRDKTTNKDKEIFALVRELNRLYRVNRLAPFVPIEKPYQNGWIKKFALRDDYTRRNDADAHRRILEKINGIAFCRNRDFLDRKGKEYGPSLKIIGKNEWDGLGWPEYYKKYFTYGVYRVNDFRMVEGYRFRRDFCFIEVIEPHIVTHTRVLYPEIESRIQEIREIFRQNRYWQRHANLRGCKKHSSDYRLARDRYFEKLHTKEIEEYDKS